MTAIVTANNRDIQNQVAPAPATKPDGSNYAWRMAFQGNSLLADADTPAELIAVLFDSEYLALDTEDERFAARIGYAKRMQVAFRANVSGNLSPEEAEGLAEWEWNVLNYGDDYDNLDPYGWGDGTGEIGTLDPEKIDFWSSKVPLVLVSTSYAPFTNVPRPLSTEGDVKNVSNILWLRPEKEMDFLLSLSQNGYIHVGRPRAALRLKPGMTSDS